MKTVLMINHRNKACGVQQSGRRIYKLLQDSEKVNFVYREVDSFNEFKSSKGNLIPNAIFFNWHQGTMPWLTKEIVKNLGIKSYFYFHTKLLDPSIGTYLFFGDYALNRNLLPINRQILVPRPLLKYTGDYRKNDTINIGSFGFPFWQKGLHTLTKLVNDTFDKAVLNFHMPKSHFGDPTGQSLKEVANECRRLNTNKNVKLNMTHNFIDDNEVLNFLAGNDINVFMYTDNGEGLSGVPDYALSVRRPIAISDCTMFRHFMKDEIRLDKHSIIEILDLGTKPLEEFYEKWSIENFIKKMEDIFNEE